MSRIPKAYLMVEKGAPYYKRETFLITSERFLIGRDWEGFKPDLPINNVYVSRSHAEILHQNNTFVILDNSKHGTKINNIRLDKLTPYPLHHGDRISLAENEAVLIFYIGSIPSETMPLPKTEQDILLDKERREVWVDGQKIDLTGHLYSLFCLLYENRGRAVSTIDIKKTVWAERLIDHSIPLVGDEEVIVLIKRLREKLGQNGRLVSNKRGYGYILR